jgi:lipoprotein-anchoring transpeptidase ErfK/SrfK
MTAITISLADQTLDLVEDDGAVRRYRVSTSRNGAGERNGSFCTPRGRHVVRARIGAGQPLGTVFVRRRPTGEVHSLELAAQHPGRDWILTRILWLSGCEPGFNRHGHVDTMRRYVYIHGTPDTTPLGIPGSIGCVRMRNSDLVELFDRVPAGTPVTIIEGPAPALGADASSTREDACD